MRYATAIAALSLVTGCGTSGVSGTLIDGMTSQPITDMRIIARATDPVGLTCQTAEGKTDAQGNFTIASACIGESSYSLSPDDKNLWLAEGAVVEKGTAEAVRVEAWRTGDGSGVLEMNGTELTRISTTTDVGTRKIPNSEHELRRPKEMPPKGITRIDPGEFLVLSGADNIAGLKFEPLLPAGAMALESDGVLVEAQPWWYVGVAITPPATVEPRLAQLDESKLIKKEAGDKAVMYIPFEALPQGRYLLSKAGERRAYVIDFGEAPTLPATADAAATP